MVIEWHILQSFPPSSLNTDESGRPKTGQFGGHKRGRISSQCFKRAIRLSPTFQDGLKEISQRTRRLKQLIQQRLIEAGKSDDDAHRIALAMTASFAGKKGKMDTKNEDLTNILVFVAESEIKALVELGLEHWDRLTALDDKSLTPAAASLVKDLIGTLSGGTIAPDLALFGRMLADQDDLQVDAALQVAHALSTHVIRSEMDFFTAVDDVLAGSTTGGGGVAAMLDYTDFNSATYYRYLCLDWSKFTDTFRGDKETARDVVRALLLASLSAIPTGKKGAFAPQSLPDFVLGIVRNGQPRNLVNAFEQPVSVVGGQRTGYLKPSIEALTGYLGKSNRMHGDNSVKKAVLTTLDNVDLNGLQEHVAHNQAEWVAALVATLE